MINDLEQRLQAALGETYRVVKELGGGGMSRVFLANETRLGRQVVIKVLPPEMGAAVNTERFEREIQLAARLQHPHIVPLLTAAASGDLLYYIMPYISGESLRAKVAREGALPVPEAVRILREVVDALAYAHGHSVVHRDIKPDNVLLSTGHAVVTDFGVAKAVSASSGGHSSLTSLGVALGTPAYMSPEQAAADPHVDHRADIYSLGALAYEMLTGRTPFVAPTPQAMLAAHITQSPDPVTRHRPNVPAPLNTILMRCLEKHPADRYQTAGELLAQLETVLTPSGGLTPSEAHPAISSGTAEALKKSHPIRVIASFAAVAVATLAVVYLAVHQFGLPDWVFYGAILLLLIGLPIVLTTGYFERKRAHARATGRIVPPAVSGVHHLFTWQRAIRGGFLSFAGLGVITAVYTAMRLLGIGPVGTLVASGRIASSSKLVVADFVNRTSDTTLGGTLTEAFRIDLAQSRLVKILNSSDMRAALGRMQKPVTTAITPEIAQEMAAREGAKAVIAGEVSTAGKSYVLVARIIDPNDGKELVALRETSPDDAGIVDAVDRLSDRVRERIGESLKVIRDGTPLLQVTTGSLEALRLYSEGARLSEEGEDARAIPILRQAVAIDSGFAMAWRKLAAAISNAGGSWAEQTMAATRAFQNRDRLPELEREATAAYYYTNVDRSTDKAETAYNRILEIDSANSIASYNLTMLYLNTGRCDEALALASRAKASGQRIAGPLMLSHTCKGDFEAARRELADFARNSDSTSAGYLRLKAFILGIEAPDDRAVEAWQRMLQATSDTGLQIQAHFYLARLALTRGRVAAAEQEYARVTGLAQADNALLAAEERARASFLLKRDSTDAARQLQQALTLHPLSTIAPADQPAAQVAIVYAMLGQVTQAKRIMADWETATGAGFARTDPDWYRARAWIAMREGRPQDAIADLRALRKDGQTYWSGRWESGLAFEQAAQPDSALAQYEIVASARGGLNRISDNAWGKARSLKRLGELYEARGDKTKALDAYGRFVNLWKDADPELQPEVREVKARMVKLAGETK